MTLRIAGVALVALLTAITISCGGGSKKTSLAPTPTSPAVASPSDARLNEAIDLAVQARALTQEQATCVFHDHPSVLQEFAQEVGLGTTPLTQIDVKSITEALIRRNAVQLDRCLTIAGG